MSFHDKGCEGWCECSCLTHRAAERDAARRDLSEALEVLRAAERLDFDDPGMYERLAALLAKYPP